MVIKEISCKQLFRMTAYAYTQLRAESENVNQLNVFPVPDGDTGTNMSMTMEGVDERAEQTLDVASCAAAMGAGMLRCARGNSGVILSVFFRGFGKGLAGVLTADAADLADALQSATTAAYGAVMNPTEGTILTVMRATSDAAVAYVKDGGDDIAIMFEQMVQRAHEALEMTPELFTDKVGDILKMEKSLAAAMRAMLGINPAVHLVAPKQIARSEGKAVRVIDKRKLV